MTVDLMRHVELLAYDPTPGPAEHVLPITTSPESAAYPPSFGFLQTITLPHIASTAVALPPQTDGLRVGGGLLSAIKAAGLILPGVG